MKEIKENKQMERYMFMDLKNQYCQNDQENLQIEWNPYQITNGIFHRTRIKQNYIKKKKTQNLHRETKDPK